MANKIQEVRTGARINHPAYQDVYNTTYEKSMILDIEMDSDGGLTGRCETEDSPGWLPVFYHCKRYCYTDDIATLENIATLEGNDSLNGGVMAFEVGHEVKVFWEKGKAEYVMDHFEQHNPPYMCADVFKLDTLLWDGSPLILWYICSEPQEMLDGIDFYGNTPNCINRDIVLFGKREFQTGTIMSYWSDRFIKVGPVFYIIRIDSIGLPGMMTKPFSVFKGVWTQEKENECILRGEAAERTIGGVFAPPPTWPVYDGLDLVNIPSFASLLDDKFGGYTTLAPRWVYTKFYGQDYEI